MAHAPLHRTVFTSIQEKIFSGEWTEGALMPTEAELCRQFGVSRITVRRALDELARLKLVERIRGKGTFVHKSLLRSGDANSGFLDAMRERGEKVTTHLLHRGLESVQPGIASILGLEAGEDGLFLAWHFRRLRVIDGVPMAIMNTFVSRGLGDAMQKYDLERESFYGLYARILGRPVARTDGVVTAITPDNEACGLLGVPEGSAQLWYKSVGYLGDGSTVETCFSIFNASRYEFVVSNFRLGEGLTRI